MKAIERQTFLRQFTGTQKSACLLILTLFICGSAHRVNGQVTLTANFDSFTNGFSLSVLRDGGVTFSNLDCRAFGGDVFDIQSTTAHLPGFSHPNYLTFDGYVSSPPPGDAYFLGRFGSADILFGNSGLSASVGILGTTPFGTSSINTLTLQALLGGAIVSSDTTTFSVSPGFVFYDTLTVSGNFDHLRLVAAGLDNNGTVEMGIDNVQITVVPEPTTRLLLLCGLVTLYGRSRFFKPVTGRSQRAESFPRSSRIREAVECRANLGIDGD